MADVAKYHLVSASNGASSLFPDLKRPFSIFQTRKSKALLSGFLVAFTLLLAFTPSYSSFSPWFTSIFSASLTANFSSPSSPTAASSSGSNLPSLSTYYFPESSPQTTPLSSSPQTTPLSSSPPRSHNDAALPPPSSAVVEPSLNSTAGTGAPPPEVVKEKGLKSNFTASLSKKKEGSDGGQSNAKAKVPVSAPTPPPEKKGNWLSKLASCDLYDGDWVRDDSYPLYKPGSCELIDEQFNCFANGRPDNGYFKYKWKPKGCNIPRLNGGHMLKLLCGKRLVFVGDSLNRNMWESLICILRTSVKNPAHVFESHGRHHFRTEAVYSFVFKDYNFTVEFFVSPFLVRQWEVKEKDGKTKETLRIDTIAESASKFKNADILIFNTGHWWTHWKTSSGKDYYQEGSHVYSELSVTEAFRRAITTWARWVDGNVDQSRTHVLFRGYSNSHFSGGQWNSGGACDNQTEPIKNTTYLSGYPWKDKVVESIIKNMKSPVSYLNITTLTDFRKDGHPSIYRKRNIPEEERRAPLQYQDCSHWCLPGVPDAWNELLYAELLIKQQQQQHLKT